MNHTNHIILNTYHLSTQSILYSIPWYQLSKHLTSLYSDFSMFSVSCFHLILFLQLWYRDLTTGDTKFHVCTCVLTGSSSLSDVKHYSAACVYEYKSLSLFNQKYSYYVCFNLNFPTGGFHWGYFKIYV